MELPQAETKQPSNETKTTSTTTGPDTYLSSHLLVPYFTTPEGQTKRPEHLIAWWSRILSFWNNDERSLDRIQLRFLCRLFRDALKPPPLYTTYPHPNYPSLTGLMLRLNKVYLEDSSQAPTVLFVMAGTFSCEAQVSIKYQMMIRGAGRDKTILTGHGFEIYGATEEGKNERVELKGLTVSCSKSMGIYAERGLSFLCEDMAITQCAMTGVAVHGTTGRLINCVVTLCRTGGIYSGKNALVEIEGAHTRVEGNGSAGNEWQAGLRCSSSMSAIRILSPLTKESISTNNIDGRNYDTGGDDGTILTVDFFESVHR